MKKAGFLMLFLIILFSCHKEDPVTDDNEDSEILAEMSIGPAGGIIETENIKLSFPEGCFSDLMEIKLMLSTEFISDFGNNRITSVYEIDGIPADFSKSISVRIRQDAMISNETFLAAGVKNDIYEEDTDIVQYKVNNCIDSSGYLISEIPPWFQPETKRKTSKNDFYQNNMSFVCQGISNYNKNISDFFKIYYPSDLELDYITKLKQGLEAALDSVNKLGMVDKENFRSYCAENSPIPVIITNQDLQHRWSVIMPSSKPLEDNLQLSNDPFIYKKIEPIAYTMTNFGIRQFSDPELRNITQRLLYRTFYCLYSGDSLDWFGISSMSYFSDRFSAFKYFDPAVYKKVFNSLLMGLEAGIQFFKSGDEVFPNCGGSISLKNLNHSYSMYPLVKYLYEKYGGKKHIIRDIINKRELSQSKMTAEGIIQAIDDPVQKWWPEFIKELITGNIISFMPDDVISTINSLDEFNFDSEQERTFKSTADYFDISAKLYRINFTMADLKNETVFNLTPDFPIFNKEYFSQLVFGLKDNSLEFLAEGPNLSFDLNNLLEGGYRTLLVAITNNTDDPPFDRQVDIEFEASIKQKAKGFTHAWFDLEIMTNYNYPSGPELRWLYYGIPIGVKGEFDNNTFTASWDGDPPDPNSTASRSVGNITIKFDPDSYPKVITDYDISETLTYLSGTYQYILTGENVHIEGSEGDWGIHSYTVSLDEACKNISSVYMIYTDFNDEANSYSTDGVPVCDNNGYLNFQLNSVEEK